MFSLLFLHFFLYGCNIFLWKKTRINYTFIFELSPTKDLKYRDVFLICTASMAAVMGVLFVHLSLVAKGYSYAQVQAIPALLLLVLELCYKILFTIFCNYKCLQWSLVNASICFMCTGLLAIACVPIQHFLQVQPIPFSSCYSKHHSITSLQGLIFFPNWTNSNKPM